MQIEHVSCLYNTIALELFFTCHCITKERAKLISWFKMSAKPVLYYIILNSHNLHFLKAKMWQ